MPKNIKVYTITFEIKDWKKEEEKVVKKGKNGKYCWVD